MCHGKWVWLRALETFKSINRKHSQHDQITLWCAKFHKACVNFKGEVSEEERKTQHRNNNSHRPPCPSSYEVPKKCAGTFGM